MITKALLYATLLTIPTLALALPAGTPRSESQRQSFLNRPYSSRQTQPRSPTEKGPSPRGEQVIPSRTRPPPLIRSSDPALMSKFQLDKHPAPNRLEREFEAATREGSSSSKAGSSQSSSAGSRTGSSSGARNGEAGTSRRAGKEPMRHEASKPQPPENAQRFTTKYDDPGQKRRATPAQPQGSRSLAAGQESSRRSRSAEPQPDASRRAADAQVQAELVRRRAREQAAREPVRAVPVAHPHVEPAAAPPPARQQIHAQLMHEAQNDPPQRAPPSPAVARSRSRQGAGGM